MRSLVKVLVITLLVGYVGAQFLPDVIHVPKRWPPRLPRIEFVHEGDASQLVPAPAASPDTVAAPLPVLAAAPSLDAAAEARRAKRAEAAARRKASARRRPKQVEAEDASWFADAPAMIVPVHITTEIELSNSSENIPTPPAPEPKPGEEWPVLCGVVVDAQGAPVARATVQVETMDITEHTDASGRFCLACPMHKLTLAVESEAGDSVRYAVELEGRTTQVRVTLH